MVSAAFFLPLCGRIMVHAARITLKALPYGSYMAEFLV
jgi:hypothetical protein